VITHVSQAFALTEDEFMKFEDLILNISIEDLVDNMEVMMPTWYKEVLDFLKQVYIIYLKMNIVFYVLVHLNIV